MNTGSLGMLAGHKSPLPMEQQSGAPEVVSLTTNQRERLALTQNSKTTPQSPAQDDGMSFDLRLLAILRALLPSEPPSPPSAHILPAP